MGNPNGMKESDLLLITVIAAVSAAASFTVFMGCFYWFRREQRRLQARILAAIAHPEDGDPPVMDSRGRRAGELVAQFRAKQGKQVISVLEADGKRFLHVDGEISAPERAKMVRYLKSEGFMS
jgi:hypothetical protein